jgi:beta-lactam-binding protein with PASTA domain
VPRMERRHLLLVAMAAAAGLGAAGAAVLVADSGSQPQVTITLAQTTVRTTTVPATTEESGVPVPSLEGLALDEASAKLGEQGFDRDVDGGGLFGVLDESAWFVCSTTPAAGERVELPATVVVHVDRSC